MQFKSCMDQEEGGTEEGGRRKEEREEEEGGGGGRRKVCEKRRRKHVAERVEDGRREERMVEWRVEGSIKVREGRSLPTASTVSACTSACVRVSGGRERRTENCAEEGGGTC
eukprot:480851-Rhodomonas_salina.1